jgi:CRISPR-associated endonuclease Csn1
VAKHGFGSYAVDPPPLKPVLVSRMPCRGAGGALHAETVRSVRLVEGKRVSVVRRALTSLKPGDLENLCDTSGVLKTALAERLALFGGNAQKAFAEPFFWPEGSGREGRVIKAVRVMQAQPSGIEVRGGVAENESMVRADVFVRDGKFWVVPVYASHVAAGVLPNRAIVAFKPESEWQEMTEEFRFLFTLRRYDLVRIVNKKDECVGYYRGTHRGTSKLTLSAPNDNKTDRGFGPRLALGIEKLGVTVLGDIYPSGPEKRHGVANNSDYEPGTAPD